MTKIRRYTFLAVISLGFVSSGLFAYNGAGGQGSSGSVTNLTVICPLSSFIGIPNKFPTVLAITHNITNTNTLQKDDFIRFSIRMNTNQIPPVCNIGNVAIGLTTVLSNNTTFTGSYIVKDNDYQLLAPIVGSVSYSGSNSQVIAGQRVNIDARLPPPPYNIVSIGHTSDPDTQFTPDTLMEIVMSMDKKVTNVTATFSISGMSNISSITMQKAGSNLLRGTYLVKQSDFMENGTLQGTLISTVLGVLKTNSMSRSNYINIGPIVKKQNNASHRIVIQSVDIAGQEMDEKDTILDLPKGSIEADSQIRIEPITLLSFKYSVKNGSGKDLCSLPKGSHLSIRYHVNHNRIDGLDIPADKAKGNIGMFYDDRADHWQLISEDVDTSKMVVTGAGYNTGVFAIMADDQITKIVIAPNPFTPGNQDGINDTVLFYVKNENHENIRALVFTLSGRKVCEIPSEKIILNGTISIAEWDGRNDNNRLMGGGIYVVKIQVGKKWYTASVVLAR